MSPNPIRVLLVDDHALFRGGVSALLQGEPGFVVVGEAGDGLEGVKRAKQLAPDVVLLDLHMPGVGGREALKLLREEVPQAKVIMLTVSEDASDLSQALREGAHGYLLKSMEVEDLLAAIRKVVSGQPVVDDTLTGKLVAVLQGEHAETAKAASAETLSPREMEVLALLARGASNKVIARELGCAETTVKLHLKHIMRKLQVSSRVQAAVYAVEQGLGQRTS
jgi:two-component system nitrate/nitrite response regulator NarL